MSDTPAPPSSEAETLASLRAALKNRRQDGGQQAEKSAPPTAEQEQAKAPAPLPETPVAAAQAEQAPKMAEKAVPEKPEQSFAPQQQNTRPPKDNWEPTPPKKKHQQQQERRKDTNRPPQQQDQHRKPQPSQQQEQRKNPNRPPQQQDQHRKPQPSQQQPQQQTPPPQPAPKPEAEEESPADRLKRLLDSHRQKASQDLEKKSEKETPPPPTPSAPPAPKEPEKNPETKEDPAASPVDALRKQMEEKRLARQNAAPAPPISLEKAPAPDVVKPAPPKVSLEKTPLDVPAPQAFMPPPTEAMPNFIYQDPLQKNRANPFAGVIAQMDKLKRTALGRFLKSLIKFTQNTIALITWTILFTVPCNFAFLSIIHFDALDNRYWHALNILYQRQTVPWIYVFTLLGAVIVWAGGGFLAWRKGWKYCGRVYGVVLKIALLPLGFLLLILYGIGRLIQETMRKILSRN